MDLTENYMSLPYYRNHDLEDMNLPYRDQLLSRMNASVLSQQIPDMLDRSGVDKQANICHGCGHLGKTEPLSLLAHKPV